MVESALELVDPPEETEVEVLDGEVDFGFDELHAPVASATTTAIAIRPARVVGVAAREHPRRPPLPAPTESVPIGPTLSTVPVSVTCEVMAPARVPRYREIDARFIGGGDLGAPGGVGGTPAVRNDENDVGL